MTTQAQAIREAMEESHSKLDSFLEGNKVRVIELVADVIEIATKPLLSDLEAKDNRPPLMPRGEVE